MIRSLVILLVGLFLASALPACVVPFVRPKSVMDPRVDDGAAYVTQTIGQDKATTSGELRALAASTCFPQGVNFGEATVRCEVTGGLLEEECSAKFQCL